MPLCAATPQLDEASYVRDVLPVLEASCLDCHEGSSAKGGIDLEQFTSAARVPEAWQLWTSVASQVRGGVMPPKGKRQPSPEQRVAFLSWIDGALESVAAADAGAPGAVPLRHLTNAEYDAAIVDLTGVDFALGTEMPADSGGGEGFTNAAGSQQVSAVHLAAWMGAAKRIADACEVLPSGLRFGQAEIGTRDPAAIYASAEVRQRAFYREHVATMLPGKNEELRLVDYLTACWKHRHAAALGLTDDLPARAAEAKLDGAFLRNWWIFLTTDKPVSRHLDLTRHAFAALPGPEGKDVPAAVKKGIAAMAVERLAWFPMQRQQQNVDGFRPASISGNVKPSERLAWILVSDAGDDAVGDVVRIAGITFTANKKPLQSALEAARAWLKSPPDAAGEAEQAAVRRTVDLIGKHPNGRAVKGDTLVVRAPIALALPIPAQATGLKCSVQLDLDDPETAQGTFQAVIRAGAEPSAASLRILPGANTYYLRTGEKSGREKFWSSFGQLRNVFPDDRERRLLVIEGNVQGGDQFRGVYHYSDNDIATRIPEPLRDNFARLREDTRLLREAAGNRIAQLKAGAAKAGKEPDAQRLTELEASRDAAITAWKDAAVAASIDLAERAWRRPLAAAERNSLGEQLAAGCTAGLDVESATRAVLVRILASPEFIYRREFEQKEEHALDGWATASRLSFFIWSSVPDKALRADAAEGRLDTAEGVVTAARRMLKDPKARRLAEEFFAQWLHIQGFDRSANPDPVLFPQFTPEVRAALHAETMAFCRDLIVRDGDLLEMLGGKHTFLTENLAAYYGVPKVKGAGWQRVDVSSQGRGGLLGMGSILTRTSYPLRTSPVLRGNWILEVVLGAPTPPPPADVPQLPSEEKAADGLSLRQRLEKHRADAACASCHDRIDPLGFALERFDAIGRLRSKDAEDRPIDDRGTAHDGAVLDGAAGLRAYLQQPAQQRQFLHHFATKLLGYALGRAVQATDQPLLRQLADGKDHRLGTYVAAIVASRQFRHRAAAAAEQGPTP